jgi:type IV pilus assembly protein PilO
MANIDLKNPAVQKIALSALLGVGVLSIFFLTHFLPFNYPNQQERLNTLKADYERKSTELARARATVADLPRFEAEYEQLHDRWMLAGELLPADRQLASLLRRITLAGQETGVEFVRFRPSSPKTETYYTEMPVQIAVHGGYHQVGSFLAELANLRRIVTVSDLRLKTNTESQDNTYATTWIELTASAYSLNTTPAAGAPANGGSASPSDARKEGDSHARKSS